MSAFLNAVCCGCCRRPHVDDASTQKPESTTSATVDTAVTDVASRTLNAGQTGGDPAPDPALRQRSPRPGASMVD